MSCIRRRRRLLFIGSALLVLALLMVLLWTKLASGDAGPRYAGRTLKQWIADTQSLDPSVHAQAVVSLRSIGTNALPTLTQWMARRDSDRERRFYELLRSRWVIPWVPSALMSHSEMAYECRALVGFHELGPRARPALPFLEDLVREKDSAHPCKAANAAGAFVYVDASQAERLAEQWMLSTNDDLITAGKRLEDALASLAGSIGRSNLTVQRTEASRSAQETNRTSGAAGSRR